MTKLNSERPLLFSIIIPTFRRHEDLFRCLNCIYPQISDTRGLNVSFSVEVIISDDARQVELKHVIEKNFPWCRYIEGPQRGPAANRNCGAKNSQGEWLIFTDDDCLPQPDWIAAYFLHVNEYLVLEGRTIPTGVRRRHDEECPSNITGGLLWSCNFAIKRTLFNDLNGFDERFPHASMEDVELSTRISKMGIARRFIEEATVLHPWRRKKGMAFARAYATSVRLFVTIHPETRSQFSLGQVFIACARAFKHSVYRALQFQMVSGFARNLFLEFYSRFLAWKLLNADNSRLMTPENQPLNT